VTSTLFDWNPQIETHVDCNLTLAAKSQFTERFDVVGIWLTLPTYFVTWTLVSSWGGRPTILPIALGLATVYTLAHVYEMRYRGHCLLSADSTAAPLAFLAFVGCCFIGYKVLAVPKLELINFGQGSALSFMLGHIFAIIVAATTHGVGELAWMLRSTKTGK